MRGCSIPLNLTKNTRQTFVIHLSVDREGAGGLTEVVQGPEGLQAWRETSPHEVIVTLSVGLVLLRGVVSTGVGGVIRRILLLAAIFI